ncbi:MAG: ATP-binding protein, partial [Desulfobacterales bacterium]|nr:ATP-binding protein [Desulfobacterales bacterium]
QADLDSLVRSKAAMYTILETLTMSVDVSLEDLDFFNVAGTFGSVINPRSAISIGMIPDLPMDRFRGMGNSSLGGAAMALTTPGILEEMDKVRDAVTYMELNVNQDFMNRFSAAKFLPHTNPALFPSVRF